MATSLKNLSEYDVKTIPSAHRMKFGIVVSGWNNDITEGLYKGIYETLITNGAKEEKIIIKHVPGSFELPYGAKLIAENKDVDAIICVGCVIQGETRHFEFIASAVSKGIIDLNLKYNIPVIFCVLTTDNLKQAKERSGGKLGNKGVEAAITAIKMADLQSQIEE